MSEDKIRQLQLGVRDNPLGSVLEQFVQYLFDRGYTALSVQGFVQVAKHYGQWLKQRPLSEATVGQFMRRHLPACQCPAPVIRNVGRNRRALKHLLTMCGVAAAPAKFPSGFVGDLLRRYEQRLVEVQGLATGTVQQRIKLARKMFDVLRIKSAGQLAKWTPKRIEDYVVGESRRYQPSTANNIACAARSLLRFLLQEGLIHRDLSAAVPSFAHWRLASLPETLSEEDRVRLINVPDVRTPVGLRDRAILLCLSELGLRASDVAGLELNGVDLASGVLTLHRSKQRKTTVLPMTRVLVDAIEAYIRHGRPVCKTQVVFVLHRPPVGRPVSPVNISGIAWDLGERANLQKRSRGAHVLRHSFASRLLCGGASVKQVADLLGHQSIDTTTIYAKVDLNSLSQVALPWPGAKEVQR